MKTILLFFCLVAIDAALSTSELCYNNKEECHSTNYQSYVDCVRRRQKRSLDCQSSCNSDNCVDTCNNCDCNSCNYNSCQNSCNNCCNSCCSNYVPCYTNHCCHKTCHSQCTTSSCRSICRKNCFQSVKDKTEEGIILEHQHEGQIGGSNLISNITNLNRHNITTIIHLNNVINNTNLIDVPIVLNNTNTQNITLINEGTGESGKTSERCCTVISPRQCVTTPKPRCFHYRSKQCGPFCTAKIVHTEQKEVCQTYYPGAVPKCSQQIMYIPQPQPRCTYSSVWPYVSCGIQKEETCQGCYTHYSDPQSNNFLTCPPQCYDDGFGMGALYRQGPIYRPSYSHAPCYQCLGYNIPYGGYLGDFGGYPGVGLGAYPAGIMGGYQTGQIGGYPTGIMGGYPVGLGGYAVPGYPGFPQQVSNVSIWNQADPANNIILEPGPLDLVNPNVDRISREVEIEVKYEPTTKAQAEVKIQNDDADVIPVKIENNLDIIDADVGKKLS